MISDKKGKLRPLNEGGATEVTLQKIAGLDYDTTSIDSSDPASIVITYLLDSILVATETITISGTTTNIIKT